MVVAFSLPSGVGRPATRIQKRDPLGQVKSAAESAGAPLRQLRLRQVEMLAMLRATQLERRRESP